MPLAMWLIFAKVLLTKYTKKEFFILTPIAMLALYNYHLSGNIFCVYTILVIVALKNVDYSKEHIKEEIADVLTQVEQLVEWANSVKEYALKQAIENKKIWPGFKLVEGISRRKWVDEDQASNTIFARCPELTEDEVFNMKLKPITSIEKIVGKKRFAELLSDVVIKPQGKPTLVPLEDKRPAMGYGQAQIDFKE